MLLMGWWFHCVLNFRFRNFPENKIPNVRSKISTKIPILKTFYEYASNWFSCMESEYTLLQWDFDFGSFWQFNGWYCALVRKRSQYRNTKLLTVCVLIAHTYAFDCHSVNRMCAFFSFVFCSQDTWVMHWYLTTTKYSTISSLIQYRRLLRTRIPFDKHWMWWFLFCKCRAARKMYRSY